jgi:hypothetical protein
LAIGWALVVSVASFGWMYFIFQLLFSVVRAWFE